ncbi:peptidylprolyl isomerase [Leptothermofonsia sichuanensis E412]|uniref:peptidylprolyl isomerase n=1 Tax=Leptothermofonsia sichuanensis TaxID=2917832 RepID=UPI001CA735B1|nr:peptidylprolyl isomerase [Leptothermofonsia sichuanensis]QZZ22239.1 peptidylprolyl isomerase [Leptothermofonsia sichuanensis E412]
MLKALRRWMVLVLMTGALLIGGCFPNNGVDQQSSASPSPGQPATSPANQENGPQAANLPRLEGPATVALVVKGQTIVMELDGTTAPITAGNFVDLVQRGFYDGLVFHRVVREPQPFVVQAGDPQSKNPNFPPEQLGTGSFIDPATSQARYIPLEIQPEGAKTPVYHQTFETAGINSPPKLRHRRGAVAMARSAFPDSASSQFYITLADANFLDGSYAVFGYVTEGMDVVDKIQQGDRIESMKVLKGADSLKREGQS